MRQSTIDSWINHVKSTTSYPSWVGELIIDVFNRYGKFISEYAEVTLYVWHESVEFSLEPKADKRHFKQSELDKIVKRHNEHFYRGEYQRFDGSCPNTLVFHFKR